MSTWLRLILDFLIYFLPFSFYLFLGCNFLLYLTALSIKTYCNSWMYIRLVPLTPNCNSVFLGKLHLLCLLYSISCLLNASIFYLQSGLNHYGQPWMRLSSIIFGTVLCPTMRVYDHFRHWWLCNHFKSRISPQQCTLDKSKPLQEEVAAQPWAQNLFANSTHKSNKQLEL